MPRFVPVVMSAILTLVAVVVLSGARAPGDDVVAAASGTEVTPLVARAVSTTTSTATSTTTSTTMPSPLEDDSPLLLADPVLAVVESGPALPVPEPIPTNPRAPTPEVVLGTIRIPAIGLEWRLGQGMTLTAIDRGPSHWPGTALPGELGNVVIAGHRTTNGAPFRHLDSLEPGDEILFDTGVETHRYAVTETLVVLPEDVWIADQVPEHVVTLFACHPPGSARYRIVVRGELVATDVASLPAATR